MRHLLLDAVLQLKPPVRQINLAKVSGNESVFSNSIWIFTHQATAFGMQTEVIHTNETHSVCNSFARLKDPLISTFTSVLGDEILQSYPEIPSLVPCVLNLWH